MYNMPCVCVFGVLSCFCIWVEGLCVVVCRGGGGGSGFFLFFLFILYAINMFFQHEGV